jgi:hypothetical protein
MIKDNKTKKENVFKKTFLCDKLAIIIFLFGMFCLIYSILYY